MTYILYVYAVSSPTAQVTRRNGVSMNPSSTEMNQRSVSKEVIPSHYSQQQDYDSAMSYLDTWGDFFALRTIHVSILYSLKKEEYDTQSNITGEKSFLCLPRGRG